MTARMIVRMSTMMNCTLQVGAVSNVFFPPFAPADDKLRQRWQWAQLLAGPHPRVRALVLEYRAIPEVAA